MLAQPLAALALLPLLAAAPGPGRQADRGPDLGDRGLDALSDGESPQAAAYRSLFTELGQGLLAWEDALARLTEIESGLGVDLRELDRLSRAQLALLRQMAARDPATLVPALALHAQSYSLHQQASRFLLAQRSRELVVVAMDIPGYSTPPAVRAGLADVLVDLAIDVEQNRMYLPARAVLERAVLVDANHLESALLLAAEYERIGSYEQAQEQLEAALRRDPRNPEARLRRGSLLLRSRRAAEAELLLDELVSESCEHWSCRVAPQELARAMMRREAYLEAAAVLEQAAERYPEEAAGYALQRALAIERAGRPGEAAAILRDLPPPGGGPSARYLYTERPDSDLVPLRERLERVRAAAPALLASVFGPGRASGGGTR
jgi:tetratricopeptide (TPR) repeat protein